MHAFAQQASPLDPSLIEDTKNEPSDAWSKAISKLRAGVKKESAREDRFHCKRKLKARLMSLMMLAMTTMTSMAEVMSSEDPLQQCKHEVRAFHGVIEAFRATDKKMPTVSDGHSHRHDSGSHLIATDNCASRCMTNSLADFVVPPRKTNIMIRGIGGSPAASCVGTALWKAEDDDGVVHSWVIPNTVCNPQVPCRLLSPQHWAQEHDEQHNKNVGCTTHHDAVELF